MLVSRQGRNLRPGGAPAYLAPANGGPWGRFAAVLLRSDTGPVVDNGAIRWSRLGPLLPLLCMNERIAADIGAVTTSPRQAARPLSTMDRTAGRRADGVAHLKVRIDRELAEQLSDFASDNRLSTSDAVRLLLRRQLTGARQEEIRDVQAAALAALMAAEHAALAIEQFSPHGDRDHALLADKAATRGRVRLESVHQFMARDDR